MLAVIIILSAVTLIHAQPVRVEPMNWWVGMKNSELQLLVHAPGAGATTAVIRYPGVTVKRTHKADSPNYLFVDLIISKTAKPGTFPIDFQVNGKSKYSFPYKLNARRSGIASTKGFSSADVIYLVTPDRFANGDEKNDIIPDLREKTIDRKQDYARHGGDLRGMINQLDYISNMGFTAIWPMPLLENNMGNASYHGYAITDFYKVDPRYGTLEEYIELADKARKKNIKLIFDGVVNHSGSRYWWMEDKPFKDWINYGDSMRITNHRRTVNQDPYASNADKELMTRGWFVRQMPDLNTLNPFLSTYMIQNSIWWIETLGLGGIRQDTYPYSPKKFLEKWTCSIMNEYPAFNITGEEWSTNPLIAAYWQQGKSNTTGYNGCLRSTMDFPIQTALVQALTEPESWNKGLGNLYEALANDFAYADPNNLLVFGDNHDMDRLFTQLKKDVDLMQMALTYLLTIRGIPQIYYGTEVLIDNSAKPGDHGLIRTDFPGGWNGDPVNGFTGHGLSADQARIQSFLKKILNWRKAKKTIHEGKTMHFAPANGVYTYFRYLGNDVVMVILNKNKQATTVSTDRFKEIIDNKNSAVNILTGETAMLPGQLSLQPMSATVFELK